MVNFATRSRHPFFLVLGDLEKSFLRLARPADRHHLKGQKSEKFRSPLFLETQPPPFQPGPRTSAPKSAKTQAAKGQGPIPHVTSIFWSIKTPKGWISTCWLEPWDRDTSKDTQNIKNINNLGLGITNKTNCTFQSFRLAFQFQNFHPGQRHVPRFRHEKQRSSTQVWCNAKRVKKKDLSLDHE